MRYYLIYVLIRGLFSAAVSFLKACFQLGVMAGTGIGSLLKPKHKIPEVDPSKDANSVKPLLDE
jgi:hypothetical protein